MTDRPEPTFRLFFAFELTQPIRELAAKTQSTLIDRVGRRDVRWTQPVDMHITALFLGNYSNTRLSTFEACGSAVANAATPFDLTIGGLGRFPERGSPRVLWVGGREDEQNPASALIDGLRAYLSDFKLDTKSFKPHITLGYVREDANRLAIERAIEAGRSTNEGTLRVERLVLMQTISDAARRKSGDARYTIVHTFPFGS